MKVILKNCNCIDEGEVEIAKERLNIKYAINGTGKTTISRAIDALINNTLDNLIPFKYYASGVKNSISEENKPTVEIYEKKVSAKGFDKNMSLIKSVRIFNEDYVNNFTFVGDDVVPNSFEIYVKTPDYDNKLKEIDFMIKDVKEFFTKNEGTNDIISKFELFLNKTVKPTKTKAISVTGLLHKTLSAGNKTIGVKDSSYIRFIQGEKAGRWAKWLVEGNEYAIINEPNVEICPYCSQTITHEQRGIIKEMSKRFSGEYLNELQTVLEAFGYIKSFFVDDIKTKIEALGATANEFTVDETNFIQSVCGCIGMLLERLKSARDLDFEKIKNSKDISNLLKSNLIDLGSYPMLGAEVTKNIVKKLNNSLSNTIDKANELQSAVESQNSIIHENIQNNELGINNFLLKAGYQYTISIEEDNKTCKYRMLLKYLDGNVCITQIKKHLSFGERNAFALVLFMYDVIKVKPDLVILDDPISSFDKHKKYAIMDMLFCDEKITLRGLTTLMLTHDFEPIADALRTHNADFVWKEGDEKKGQFVKATFLYNTVEGNDGKTILKEKPILDCNVKNYLQILKDNAKSATNIISKLVFLRRLKEIEKDKTEVWDVLSSFFHNNKPTPQSYNNSLNQYENISEDKVKSAEKTITESIGVQFVYANKYSDFWDVKEMISCYELCESGYEKLQIFRCLSQIVEDEYSEMTDKVFAKFINETYHSEMDYIFQLCPKDFETVPHHIMKRCNCKVEDFKIKLQRNSI